MDEGTIYDVEKELFVFTLPRDGSVDKAGNPETAASEWGGGGWRGILPLILHSSLPSTVMSLTSLCNL